MNFLGMGSENPDCYLAAGNLLHFHPDCRNCVSFFPFPSETRTAIKSSWISDHAGYLFYCSARNHLVRNSEFYRMWNPSHCSSGTDFASHQANSGIWRFSPALSSDRRSSQWIFWMLRMASYSASPCSLPVFSRSMARISA